MSYQKELEIQYTYIEEEEEEQGNPLDELLSQMKALFTRWKAEEDETMKDILLQQFLLLQIEFDMELVKGGENKTK